MSTAITVVTPLEKENIGVLVFINRAICDVFVPLGIIRSLNIGIAARAAAGDCPPET